MSTIALFTGLRQLDFNFGNTRQAFIEMMPKTTIKLMHEI